MQISMYFASWNKVIHSLWAQKCTVCGFCDVYITYHVRLPYLYMRKVKQSAMKYFSFYSDKYFRPSNDLEILLFCGNWIERSFLIAWSTQCCTAYIHWIAFQCLTSIFCGVSKFQHSYTTSHELKSLAQLQLHAIAVHPKKAWAYSNAPFMGLNWLGFRLLKLLTNSRYGVSEKLLWIITYSMLFYNHDTVPTNNNIRLLKMDNASVILVWAELLDSQNYANISPGNLVR